MSSVNGFVYQLKLLMLFVMRGVFQNWKFSIGTEIKKAKKFDDLVFKYERNGQKYYRLLQSKHRQDVSKKINMDHLLTDQDTDFGIVKYFFSYVDIKGENFCFDGCIEDVTICTNVDFDYGSIVSKNKLGDNDKKIIKLEELIDKIEVTDDLLDCGGKGTRYRFNDKIISILKPMIENYNLIRVAKRLSDCIFQNIPICENDYILKPYCLVLVEKVLDVRNNKFHTDFILGRNMCSLSSKIRHHLKAELKKKFGASLLSYENNHININIPNEKTFEKFQEAFEDNDIKNFLDHFVFAVNQPNEIELGNFIKNEIKDKFPNLPSTNCYNTFFVNMLEWMKDGENFLSHKEVKAYLNLTNNEIKFNIKEPVKYFTGRNNELEKLKELLSGGITVVSQNVSIDIGGIGKSELVKKYVQLYSELYDGNIIWINCDSTEDIEKTFQNLARTELKIATYDHNRNENNILDIVRNVHASFSDKKCLFIFDNATSMDDIKFFLPLFSHKSSVLITSRNQIWRDINVLLLESFSKDEARSFIKDHLKINDPSENGYVDILIDVLRGFPSALDQAVSFINQKNEDSKKYSIVDYVKEKFNVDYNIESIIDHSLILNNIATITY